MNNTVIRLAVAGMLGTFLVGLFLFFASNRHKDTEGGKQLSYLGCSFWLIAYGLAAMAAGAWLVLR